jgi:hypothetical protein
MDAINKIKIMKSKYEQFISQCSRNEKVYKKDFYRYFIDDLKRLENDIFIEYIKNNKLNK